MRVSVLLLLIVFAAQAREVKVRLRWLSDPKGPVVTMDLEQYVAAVVAGECGGCTSTEALKAIAVAARTWGVRHLGRHKAEGFDFCDTTHCQDVRVSTSGEERVQAAVGATEGEMLWHEGRPILAFHHRGCGGHTASAAEVWPGIDAPYLKGVPDTFCTHSEWRTRLTEEARVTRRGPNGRVQEVAHRNKRLTWEQFARAVPGIESNKFAVAGMQVVGEGSGHGVGLCQTGAEARGKSGEEYPAILAAYFPGTKLGVSAQGLRWARAAGERVEAFARTAAEAGELARLGDRAVAEAEKRTGLSAPKVVRVRSYPNAALYRDATAAGGGTLGHSRGTSIRLQPLALLRSRGTLEGTLLHEALHVLIDAHAAPELPDAFREDVAAGRVTLPAEELAQALKSGKPPGSWKPRTPAVQPR